MKNYVISMINAEQRRKHISTEFTQMDIPFYFFNAISLDNNFDQSIKRFCPALENSILTNGEKGCFLSHISLWNRCIEEDLNYIAIFEDDIVLSRESHFYLKNDEWLEERFLTDEAFILRLETFPTPNTIYDNSKINDYNDRSFKLLKSLQYGTAGYIISNKAAKLLINLLKNSNADNIFPIDNWLFNNKFYNDKLLIIYQLYPAISIQEQQYNQENSILKSDLHNERKIRDQTLKGKKTIKTRFYKVIYNIRRIISGDKWKKRKEQINIIPFK